MLCVTAALVIEDADFVNAAAKKHWDDETGGDDVKDEWDASSESEEEQPAEKAPLPVSAKPKKGLELAIEKREQREQEERLAAAKKKLMAASEPVRDYSGLDEKTAQKLRLRDAVEEADRENAEQLFAGASAGKEADVKPAAPTVETMQPKTEAEFTLFAELAAAAVLRHSVGAAAFLSPGVARCVHGTTTYGKYVCLCADDDVGGGVWL